MPKIVNSVADQVVRLLRLQGRRLRDRITIYSTASELTLFANGIEINIELQVVDKKYAQHYLVTQIGSMYFIFSVLGRFNSIRSSVGVPAAIKFIDDFGDAVYFVEHSKTQGEANCDDGRTEKTVTLDISNDWFKTPIAVYEFRISRTSTGIRVDCTSNDDEKVYRGTFFDENIRIFCTDLKRLKERALAVSKSDQTSNC